MLLDELETENSEHAVAAAEWASGAAVKSFARRRLYRIAAVYPF
jgi:hypothetical protein